MSRMSGWQREQARQLLRQKKAAAKKVAKIDRDLAKYGEEARRLILSAPPGFVDEMVQKVKDTQAALNAIESDPAATPAAKAAKKKEFEEARKALAFVHETILDSLPKALPPPPTKGPGRGR